MKIKQWDKLRLKSILLLVLALCFILIGISRNENETVLNKGTNLCLECVGIG